MMKTTKILASAAVLVLATALSAADAPTLAGSWIAVSAERNGKPADDVKGHVLRFQGDRFTITLKGQVIYEGTFTTDPAAKPPAIDFIHTGGKAKGKTWKGIYDVSKERLKTSDNAPDLSKPRPKDLTNTDGYVSIVFDRVK